jgi:hypothetical protein
MCSLGGREKPLQKHLRGLDTMVHTYNSSTYEVEARGWEFKANLLYVVRPHVKKNQSNKQNPTPKQKHLLLMTWQSHISFEIVTRLFLLRSLSFHPAFCPLELPQLIGPFS